MAIFLHEKFSNPVQFRGGVNLVNLNQKSFTLVVVVGGGGAFFCECENW